MKDLRQFVVGREFLEKDMIGIVAHSIIVSKLAYLVGKEMGIPECLCYELAVAGIMHDIGKIRLDSYVEASPYSTIKKFRQVQKMVGDHQLDTDEVQYVRMHSRFSYEILKEYGYSDIVLDTVLYHHENYDGTGYPEGLQGTDIPMGARILRVCDVFAALIGKRMYRGAFDEDTAVAIMIDEVKNFDMRVFLAFQRVIHETEVEEIFEMMEKYKEKLAGS
ncbi:MAG: HD domain-containing protein [Lachnospiraceae bacterium]|nr:HD domain-containing protein [Lachnospiraceae bacterium]